MRLNDCFFDLNSTQRKFAMLLLISLTVELDSDTSIDIITDAYRCISFKKLDARWAQYTVFAVAVPTIIKAKCDKYPHVPRSVIEDIFVQGIAIGWLREHPWILSIEKMPTIHEVLRNEIRAYRSRAVAEGLC